MQLQDASQIINYIKESTKTTPVKLYVNGEFNDFEFPEELRVYGSSNSKIIFGDWKVINEFLTTNEDIVTNYDIENDCRNSAIPLLDLKGIKARIEPGSIIRDQVEIGDNAVIMMGATINIGAVIGENTMIDMNTVLGGRATVGRNCHIGAGAVLAGVIEPPSASPVVVEDDVVIGANAVVLEGVRIGKGAVVAAGAIVIDDVKPNTVVAGIPAKFIKSKDTKTIEKTVLVEALREL